MKRRYVLAAALALLALPGLANAQSYPDKPVKVVVGYPPGGAVDFVARLVSERLSTVMGQPFLVENRPGAGGQIAADSVSKSPPDGYTLIFAVGSDLTWIKFLTKKKVTDPLTELTPIATANASVNCIVVNANSLHKTFKDLVAYAKQHPNKLSYGSTGLQSYYYLIGESLRFAGMPMLHVPYKGTAPTLAATLSGELDVGLLPLGVAKAQAEAGKVRMLAVFDPKRYSGQPDIPAIKEELPAFNAPQSWFGFFGPPGLPQPMVEKLHAEIGKAIATPEVAAKIKAQNLEPMTLPLAEMRPFIQASTDTFAALIKTAKIEPVDD
jgi:tripartite-type tricarboxylate transporter receptor subunit TctC